MDRVVENRGSGGVGMTFLQGLPLNIFSMVRGNTHLQVELKKKNKKRDLQILQPHARPGDLPTQAMDRPAGRPEMRPRPRPSGAWWGQMGLTKQWGPVAVGRLGHVIRLRGWGVGSFPSLSVGLGSGPARSQAQTRSGEGRGAFTVQDARRRRAEVTRLLLGAGLTAPSPGSKPAPLQIQISVMLHRNR